MKTDKIEKALDCVEMKRRIQERIYEETRDMDAKQLVAYFRRRVEQGAFADLWSAALPQSGRGISS